MCSTTNVELVRSIGADHVIDYKKEDFTEQSQSYDLVFYCVGNHSLSAYRRTLNRGGICVMVGDLTGRGMLGILARLITAAALSPFRSKKLVTFVTKPNRGDLNTICDLMKTGKVRAVIDRSYRLSQASEALRYLEAKHARGKVIISLESHIEN